MTGPEGLTVVVTGATGAAGRATVRELTAAGAAVIAVGRNRDRLDTLGWAATDDPPAPGTARGDVVDLSDAAATERWAAGLVGPVDGLIHLVGGWRGGSSFTDNSVADAEWLHDQVVRTTQHVTLALHDGLAASRAGRFAIVSARAASRPTAGNAAYASAKAAAETWTLALADSFGPSRRGRAPEDGEPEGGRSRPTAAATIFVVDVLVDESMRSAEPTRSFARATDVDGLARAVVSLWSRGAAVLNGARIDLVP